MEHNTPAAPTAAPQFTDLAGRQWTLTLNVRLAQTIRDQLGVNFLKAHEGRAIAALADSEKLVQVLWMVCEAQAANLGVSPEEFGAAISGDQLGQAYEAVEAMILLFTPPAQRPAMQAMASRAAEVQKRTVELAVRKLNGRSVSDKIERELSKAEEKFEAALADPSTESSSPTNGPASPAASTPARTA